MLDCIFCKIVKDEAPAHKIWENENFLAFLTIGPINAGHMLLIPKIHIDYVFDLSEPLYSEMFTQVKQLAKPLKEAMQSKRIAIAIEGFGVAHLHIHLVPVHGMGDLDPCRESRMDNEQLAAIATRIKAEINS